MKYISTDIDRIIEYLKNRKKAELIEVSRALEIKPMDVEKWAQILENEGLIELEHTFTKMYLVWLNTKEEINDTVVLKTGVRGEKTAPKSVLVEKATTTTSKSMDKEISKIVPTPVMESKVELPEHNEIKLPDVDFETAKIIGSDIEDRMKLINESIKEIAELKGEREKLNNSEYVTIVTKYDAQLSSLDEKLAQRELAVMSLKKKLTTLPEILNSVSVEFNGVTKSYYDLEKEYNNQVEGLVSLKSEVSNLRKDLQTEIKYSKEAVNVCAESLSSLDEQIETVNLLREEASKRIIEANMNIEKERKVISEMNDVLETTNVRVDEMKSLLDDVNERVSEAKNTFNEITEYESKLAEAESMLKSIEKTYTLKLDKLRKAIEDSESEATKLNVDLQKSYMANYLKELDNLSKNYSKEIGQIRKKDEDLERKIKAAQEKLSWVLKQ